MNTLLVCALLLGFLFLSAIYSGSETGVYSVSRIRLDAEAREGRRAARLLLRLLRDDAGLLITLLIGNNLMLLILTGEFEERLVPAGLPSWTREIVVALALTPVVFLLGELLPKDVFRRRPHRFLSLAAPVISVSRLLFLPLAAPLVALSVGLERLFGLRRTEVARALGREEMLDILEEGTRTGALAPHAEELARNVLVLRETPVQRVMLPWKKVCTVDLDLSAKEARAVVEESEYTRLPALRTEDGASGRRVVGYVHQLDVLGGEEEAATSLRPLPAFAPDLPIDRALARLRISGQRLALVGLPETPRGLVTLMDLVAAISGRAGRRPPGRR